MPYWIQDLDAPKCWRFCFDLDAGKSKPTENRHCRVGGKSHRGGSSVPPAFNTVSHHRGRTPTGMGSERLGVRANSKAAWRHFDADGQLEELTETWSLQVLRKMRPFSFPSYETEIDSCLQLEKHRRDVNTGKPKGKVIPLPHPFAANTVLCITENNTFVH